MMVFDLVGDIGGTNARFALVEPGTRKMVQESSQRNAGFDSLQDALAHWLAQAGNPVINAACIDIAGPVTGDQVALTNLPWSFSVAGMKRDFGLAELLVINDFHAQAMALPFLADDDRIAIGGGVEESHANKVVIGPGTGLGVGGLVYGHGCWNPVAGEGGHISCPAFTPREKALVQLLQQDRLAAGGNGAVNAECLLCGEGIARIYEYLLKLDKIDAPLLSPEEITPRAIDGSDRVAVEALEIFLDMLAETAANTALLFGAKGGVYLAGGIPPRLVDILDHDRFRERFALNLKQSGYLAAMPVWLVTAAQPGLLGCAAWLQQELQK